MAINKKLITFDKKLTFLGANGINNLSSPVDGYYNLIPTWSMVFIKDTGEIWHDGVYFGKPIKDQIAPIMSGTTKGIVFTPNGTNYYYKTFNLWGNTFDGNTININGNLEVQGVTYKWTYGDASIKKGNTNLIAFSNNANNYDVFIPNGDLKVTGGDVNVNNGKIILDSTGSIKGTYILNTNSYFNADNTLGKTWNSIKLFSTSGTTISLDTTRPAIINILEHTHASGTLWVPWIAGGDITELSSWGIGLGGDAFYIGRISKAHTENSLSEYWKFDATDGITISGATKYIKVANITDSSNKMFMADGTLKSISNLIGIGEATTSDYGGIKLSLNKASSQQSMTSSTTGNGRYAIKMNADGTLYVEFSQANTWKAANSTLEGYIPKLESGGTALANSTNDYILAFTYASSGTLVPSWKKLPGNAYKNDNTTYKLTINNTTNGDTSSGVNLGSFYAPTTLGTNGQILGTNGTTLEWKTLEKDALYTATLSEVDLTTSWSNVDNLSTRLAESGSYIVQITYASCIYTGTFSYVLGGTVDDEIILHCSGTIDSVGGTSRGRLYAKIGTSSETTYLKLAVSLSESNANLSIKYRKLI